MNIRLVASAANDGTGANNSLRNWKMLLLNMKMADINSFKVKKRAKKKELLMILFSAISKRRRDDFGQ